MKKIWLIGWKDLTLAFRDKAALVLMLAAPFALTLGLGLITGHLSGGGSSGISHIPVVLVNEDGGQLGSALIDIFGSADLATLVAPEVLTDADTARRRVDADQAAAAVIIPAGFTTSIIPAQGSPATGDVIPIALYTNPARPTSAGVIRAIVDEFLSRVEAARIGGEVVAIQLVEEGLVNAQGAVRAAAAVGQRQATEQSTAIRLSSVTASGEATEFDMLAYLAPGMALMFLMYTVSHGGRTLLAERAQGTLPRLLVSPTAGSQVLGGKVVGILLTGVVQMLILIGASAMLFQLRWGSPVAVLALVVAAVIGATGWGMLITAVAKTPGQVSAIGSAVMLAFGILGGTFINMEAMPAWFVAASRITPNAWGLEGFATLALGRSPAEVLKPVLALLLMGAGLFAVAVLIYNRRGIAQQ